MTRLGAYLALVVTIWAVALTALLVADPVPISGPNLPPPTVSGPPR